MKKAKIVLSLLLLVAVIGGAFAFKASKFTPLKIYTITTTTYTTLLHGTVYVAPDLVYCTTATNVFRTNNGSALVPVFTTFTTPLTTSTATTTNAAGNTITTTITYATICAGQINTFTTNVE